jgi:succinate dehydrogenase/fumarate reductase flavoprotein subunit
MIFRSTDVLIIGAGAAGIRAAIAACERGVEVILVAAEDVAYGGSTFSEISKGWGMQALVGAERTTAKLENFYEEILRIGLDQSDPDLVRVLVEESGPRTEDLISYGLRFKKGSDGDYIRAKGCFGTTERAFLTRDMGNIRQTFLSILRRLPVRVVTGRATDLIVDDGICRGARLMLKTGEVGQINTAATILATGGGSGIFDHHLGNGGIAGDGCALAHLAGAALTNMEFIQFALGLKNKETRQFLPLAELGASVKMTTSGGDDILERYLPGEDRRGRAIRLRQNHMPFSCRDSSGLVDIAIARAMVSGQNVYWRNGCPENDRFHVVHFAHAFNGGIKINARAESSVPGLFAAGEVAAGPHGADRMGGCMMTATQVFGKRAGEFAARRAQNSRQYDLPSTGQDGNGAHYQAEVSDDVLQAFSALENRVRTAMGQYAGVLRNKKGLIKCKKILETCTNHLNTLGIMGLSNFHRYYNVRNMIITADLVVQSALARKKSKGSHYREDSENS